MLRFFSVLICLFLGLQAQAHLLKAPVNYMVFFEKGLKWEKSKPYKNQKNIGEHIIFIKKMYRNKQVLLAGSFENQSETMVLVQGLKKEQILKRLNQSPAVKAGVLKYRLKEFTVTMQGQVVAHQH